MNYGLYLSASGVLTNLYRQDVFSNNLANVKTVGFQRDLAMIHQRSAESIEDPTLAGNSHELLDKLGGGVFAGPQSISFKNGPMEHTGNPLDVALEAEKTFFNVRAANPEGDDSGIRLTRDGRFSRDAEGYLVTIAGGHHVLDDADQPIELGEGGEVTIDPTGRIFVEGQVVARLGIKTVSDTDALTKRGKNLLGWEGADIRTDPPTVAMRAGFVEASGVDPVVTLMNLIAATKAVSGNANLIRYHDTLMDRAVNTLGRVA